MKYFILFTLIFSGCASISEYNQGCRDGISSVNINHQGMLGPSKGIDDFCDGLDSMHKNSEKEVNKH